MRRYFLISALLLAACGQPAGDGWSSPEAVHEHRSPLTLKRDAQMRRRMNAGLFGHAQLFPGQKPVDPRRFAPLPPPESILQVVLPPAAATPASVAVARVSCVYKPVMSNEDIAACR